MSTTTQKVEVITLEASRLEELLAEAAARGARLALRDFIDRPAPQRPLATIQEAAKILNMSVETLRRRRKQGRISAVTESPLRFDVEEVRKQMSA